MIRTQRRGGRGAVRSVDRAVSVLEFLARHGEAGATEIADEPGVHRSTVFRLLGALENRGLVARTQGRGEYFPERACCAWRGATAVRPDISREGVPVCRGLAGEPGETADIAVLGDDAAVDIMRARGTASVTVRNRLGRRTTRPAARCCSPACRPPCAKTCRHVPCPRLADRTVTGMPTLRTEREAVVEQGHGATVEELERGLAGVAASSVPGPVCRPAADRLPGPAKRMAAAGGGSSRRVGHGFRAEPGRWRPRPAERTAHGGGAGAFRSRSAVCPAGFGRPVPFAGA
ncbi:IclR family transcriptional regulator [Streptomyces sp. NPDC093586]|uniref:IclR family transcriptional regulator n=1 Tax=Streptomyces sp. NPDC093586 TaxID=3366042 RepID=UPI003827A2F2